MTHTEDVRTALRDQIAREGLRPFSARTGLPMGQIRGLLEGRAVLSTTLDAVATALELSSRPLVVSGRAPEDWRPLWADELYAEIADLRKVILHAGPTSQPPSLTVTPDEREEGEEPEQPTPHWAKDFRQIPDLDVDAAAGPETYVEEEMVIGHLAFREDWLTHRGINPGKCSSIRVQGSSMEPTLKARSRILVDRQRTRRLRDRIFVVWTEDGVVVKRLARDGDDWVLVSDNEDQEAYPPIPWPEGAVVRGQVMWTGRNL